MLATNEAAHPPRMSLSMESMVEGASAGGKLVANRARTICYAARPATSQERCAVARTTNGVAADDDDAALTAVWATQGASSSEPADREH